MSRKSEAKRSVTSANNRLGGAFSTRAQRRKAGQLFVDWCFKKGLPLTSIKQATFNQVKAYLVDRGLPPDGQPVSAKFIAEFSTTHGRKPLSCASLHNILGSIRRAMVALGADPTALGMTTGKLGLASKSRLGTKLPVTDEVFFAAVAKAEALGEMGYAIMLKIERYFGHRGQESLMSPAALKRYALDAADMIRRDGSDLANPAGCVLPLLAVTDGTKTGRPRLTASIAKYAHESLETIAEALRYLETHPFLVEGKTKGLKSARQKMQTLARKCGLTGQYSPHSLRYRYAVDKLTEMRDAGVSRAEAFELCSEFLGHGPCRGRYISMVYGRTIVSSFPRTRRRRDFKAAAREIENIVQGAFARKARFQTAINKQV